MLVSIAGPLVVVPVIGAAGLFAGGSALRLLVALGFPAAVGGVLAGRSLQRGWRGSVAFGIAFPVGVAVALFAVTTLGALSGRETPGQLVAAYVGILSVAYALIGVVGASIAGLGWRLVGRALPAFGASGAAGGLVLAVVAMVLSVAGTAGPLLQVVGSAAAFLVPAATSGWWLGRILAPHS